MSNIFETVAVNKIRHSLFNLSHMRKFSCDMGYLIPIQVSEVLPNDTIHVQHEALVKFAPLVAPMMQECDFFIEDFFVPNRILWDSWNDFITPSDTGIYPAMPYTPVTSNTSPFKTVGSLADFLGIPVTEVANLQSTVQICSLAFRAYQLIWNTYYRDQNLQPEVDIQKSRSGNENASPTGNTRGLYTLRKRCWPKDYFTSALPTTQRGGDVRLPLTSEGEVDYKNISMLQASGNPYSGNLSYNVGADPLPSGVGLSMSAEGAVTQVGVGMRGTLDLKNVTSATINELRQAVALQEYLELNMRVGGRINEYIYGNFGIHVPDYRLDRPEFLGGFRSPIVINQVDQTSQSDATPLGEMAGNATGVGNTRKVRYKVQEHGWYFSLFSVLPKVTYQQGLPRKFTRFDPLDYANPKFGNLGEQAILNKEIYLAASNPDGVFGYTPRYSEYKYEPSTVHGEFKTTLNFWHQGNIYDSEPALNGDFVTANPSTRVFADETNSNKLRVEVYNKVKALRPLPYYGTPKLL